MDDGKAMFVDMLENVGEDFTDPMTYSNVPEMEQENAEVVELINQRVLKVTIQPTNCCIYRVPQTLFKENPAAYIPQMISIGPFHHDKPQLQSMEPFKMYYFREFLSRSSPSKLENYVKAVTNLAGRAYQCYSEMKVERKSFIMMMVVDGGFILGLLLKIMHDEYFSDESNSKLSDFAFVDLILLENQLPFFILEELYRLLIEDSCEPDFALRDVIRRTLVPLIVGLLVGKDRIDSFGAIHDLPPYGEPKHLLDLVRQFLIPSSSPFPWLQRPLPEMIIDVEGKLIKPEVRSTKHLLGCASTCIRQLCPEEARPRKGPIHVQKYNLVEPMRCATELEKANVKFVENKNPKNLLDITFDNGKGVLKIPGMIIDRGTEIVLRNLVVYEQYTNDYSYITDYAAFLDDLIISLKDAELLQNSGIIDTKLGDPGEVAQMFDQFVKDVAVPCYYTNPVRLQLERHCNRSWNKVIGALFQTFYRNRWAFVHNVSFLLLCLTFIQTIYVALTYHHN